MNQYLDKIEKHLKKTGLSKIDREYLLKLLTKAKISDLKNILDLFTKHPDSTALVNKYTKEKKILSENNKLKNIDELIHREYAELEKIDSQEKILKIRKKLD